MSEKSYLFSLFGTLSIGSAYKTFNCTVTRPSLRVCKWRVSSALAACEATWNLTYATAVQMSLVDQRLAKTFSAWTANWRITHLPSLGAFLRAPQCHAWSILASKHAPAYFQIACKRAKSLRDLGASELTRQRRDPGFAPNSSSPHSWQSRGYLGSTRHIRRLANIHQAFWL